METASSTSLTLHRLKCVKNNIAFYSSEQRADLGCAAVSAGVCAFSQCPCEGQGLCGYAFSRVFMLVSEVTSDQEGRAGKQKLI